MSPNDFEHLKNLAEDLDRSTTFRDGGEIRRQVQEMAGDERQSPEVDLDWSQAPSGDRSPFVLAMAAMALVLVAGGAIFNGVLRQPAIGVAESASEAASGDDFDDVDAESDDEMAPVDPAETDAMVIVPEQPTGPSTSLLSAPTTVNRQAAIEQTAEGALEQGDTEAGSGAPDPPAPDIATTTMPDAALPAEEVAPPADPLVEVDPVESNDESVDVRLASQVYDGFGTASANAIFGFAEGSGWELSGAGSVMYLPDGLDYADAGGRLLITFPGSISVRPSDRLEMSRPIDGAYDPQDTYYVSYVIRVDTENYGDAFWTPPDPLNKGAFGVQQFQPIKFVNGPDSAVDIVPGVNYFVVGRVSEGLVEMWVNPDLARPGSADVVHEVVSVPAPTADFGFSRLGDGAYVLDEFRMGYSWRSVAPYAR